MMPISFLQRGFKSQGYVVMTLDIHIDTYCLHTWVKFLLKEHFYLHALLCFLHRYTYRVLQTIKMKLILLCVWAGPAVLGSTKAALKFKYEIWMG